MELTDQVDTDGRNTLRGLTSVTGYKAGTGTIHKISLACMTSPCGANVT